MTTPPPHARVSDTQDTLTSAVRPAPGSDHPVCVIGPLFLDVVMTGLRHAPRPGEEQWVDQCAIMAGGCANQAVALARLDLPVTLRSYLGTDQAGRLVRTHLEAEDIDLGSCPEVPTQSVTVSLSFDGDRAMTTAGSDESPALDGVQTTPSAVVADLRAVETGRAALEHWSTQAHPPVVLGDVGWDDTERWDPADLDPLDLVHVFVPNEVEAQRYTRTRSPHDAARALAERVPLAVVTCGPQGVVAVSEGQEISLPAAPVTPLDPTGAGDSFSAGLLWGLAHRLSLRGALSFASLTAACTLRAPGGSANAPRLPHVAQLARSLELPDGYDLSFLDLISS
ncbi:carbohydrate kinase family protein [Actinomyces faecalis]|uniref:carbohydrate kinase family protein n=1 Tax=Actinomyces faecalis TaxID=2722820 RepID=UPI0015533877|nr:carbohydrate kinase family protein [Actinomyces faecalis]